MAAAAAAQSHVEKYPISLQWRIPREEIENHQVLRTKEITTQGFFGVSYYIQLYVAETHQDERGNVAVYFYVNPKNSPGGVTAEISISLPTVNRIYPTEHFYINAHDWGVPFCRSEFFLKENSPAFVNGEFIVKINGFLTVESPAGSVWNNFRLANNDLGSQIWDSNENKDFTLIVEGKELKVHKIVLSSCSEVFADIFATVNSFDEENNHLEIDDFTFECVEAVVMYCYEENGYINDSNIAQVCKFVDKYEIKGFKNNIIPYMISNISSMNVCQYINAAHYLQDSKLEMKCMDFLQKCTTNKIAIFSDDLYPGFAKKFLDYQCCNNIPTHFFFSYN